MLTLTKHQFLLYRTDAISKEKIIDNISDLLKTLPSDEPWIIDIEKYGRPRTSQQNKALWGVAYKTLSEETGHDPIDLHDYFLCEYFGSEVKNVFGKKRRTPNHRSSTLTTDEFAGFYRFVQRKAAEMGYIIPDPNELVLNHYSQQK